MKYYNDLKYEVWELQRPSLFLRKRYGVYIWESGYESWYGDSLRDPITGRLNKTYCLKHKKFAYPKQAERYALDFIKSHTPPSVGPIAFGRQYNSDPNASDDSPNMNEFEQEKMIKKLADAARKGKNLLDVDLNK